MHSAAVIHSLTVIPEALSKHARGHLPPSGGCMWPPFMNMHLASGMISGCVGGGRWETLSSAVPSQLSLALSINLHLFNVWCLNRSPPLLSPCDPSAVSQTGRPSPTPVCSTCTMNCCGSGPSPAGQRAFDGAAVWPYCFLTHLDRSKGAVAVCCLAMWSVGTPLQRSQCTCHLLRRESTLLLLQDVLHAAAASPVFVPCGSVLYVFTAS